MQFVNDMAMKKLILIMLSLSIFVPLSAKVVTSAEAESIAAAFFESKPHKSVSRQLKRALRSNFSDNQSVSEYYIYNNGENDGFVIVAGDSNISPILAYSDTGSFDWNNLPPNLEEWLSQMKVYVKAMSRADKGASETIPKPEAKVLYETAEWGQNYPFNARCPLDGTKRTLTGCTATSFAILLRYFEYPYSGYNVTESYSYVDAARNNITIGSESLSGPFHWDDMPLKYSTSWTQDNIEAVSEIMYICSVSAKAAFGVKETPGDTYQCHKVLQTNLDYDKASLYHRRSWYSDGEWISRVIAHLDKIGPLLYSANSREGGHSFIVDGYDSEINFHINWGWKGYMNGYFAFPAWLSYRYDHQAAFGVQPDRGGKPEPFLSLSNSWDCKGITLDGIDEVVENDNFTIKCGFLKIESVSTAFRGYVSAAVIDKSDRLKEFISKENVVNLDAGYGYSAYSINCKISKDIEVGDRITLFQRRENDTTWNRVPFDREHVVGELPISDLQTIEETTSLSYDAEGNVLTLELKDAVRYSLDLAGVPYLSGISEKEVPVRIDVSDLPLGNYDLCLTKKRETVHLKLNMGGKKDE